MRALGIDFGIKRVGLALSDPLGILASPYKTIEREGRADLFADIVRIIEAEGVEAVAVGLPLSLEGEETLSTRQARNFAESLRRRVSVPVDMVDERLTSAEAEERLKEAGLCSRKRRKVLDSQAAVLILESWMQGVRS